MKIGTAIKTTRQLHTKMGQSEMAKSLGISQTHLSLVEAGKKNPSLDLVQKICLVANLPISLMMWYSIEDSDIPEGKKEMYRLVKPFVINLIDEFK